MKCLSYLFAFLGVYGDVQRVKILYNKKDSALVQLAEPHQAHLGKLKFHRIILWRKTTIFAFIPENIFKLKYLRL